jgi:hypothetical protein
MEQREQLLRPLRSCRLLCARCAREARPARTRRSPCRRAARRGDAICQRGCRSDLSPELPVLQPELPVLQFPVLQGLITDRETLITDRETLITDRETLITDRETLITDRETLITGRQTVSTRARGLSPTCSRLLARWTTLRERCSMRAEMEFGLRPGVDEASPSVHGACREGKQASKMRARGIRDRWTWSRRRWTWSRDRWTRSGAAAIRNFAHVKSRSWERLSRRGEAHRRLRPIRRVLIHRNRPTG